MNTLEGKHCDLEVKFLFEVWRLLSFCPVIVVVYVCAM